MKLLLFIIPFLILFSGCGEPPTTDQTGTNNDDPVITEPIKVPSYFPISINYPGVEPIIVANSSFKYLINGGKPPYSFEYISGPGNIDETGLFTAGEFTGNTLIDIKDSSGQVIRSKIHVNANLKIDPANIKLNVSDSVQLNVTGGIPPYSYFIQSGSGFVNGLGFFTSTQTPIEATINIYDSQNNSVTAQISTKYPLSVSPNQITINRGETIQFVAQNGFPPYSYRVIGDVGSISFLTGLFSSPPTSTGNIQVETSDSIGTKVVSQISIVSNPLSINNQNLTIEVNKSFQFKAFGGLAPYTFSRLSGNGTVLPSGLYYSSPTTGTDVVQLTDAENNSVFANISVTNQLTISPASLVTNPNLTEQFSANGGVPPYTFQITSGNGTVSNQLNNSEGIFTAASNTGNVTLQLRDSANTTVTASIEVSPELFISPTNPIVSIGNQIVFIGSGGVPPYQFDIVSGPGNINVNGTFSTDSGIIFSPQSTIVRITDSKNIKKTTTITINPFVDFLDPEIIVRSGNEKIIQGINGVPPYTLKFKNTTSLFGSSIQNIPDQIGGFILKYIAGFVSDDVFEKIQIVDSLNNITEKSVMIFGGLVAYLDPDKNSIIGSNILLGSSSIQLNNNSDLALINSLNHNLTSSSTIRLKNGVACSNFEDFDFNKRFDTSIIDSNNFSIQLLRKSNQTLSCGNGSNFSYDVLSNKVGTLCPIGQNISLLNLRNYSSLDLSINCSSQGSAVFFGTCGKKTPICSDPYRIKLSRSSISDPVSRDLSLNLPLSQVSDDNVSVEMWFKWDGDRSPDTSPVTSSFNGTLVGFNNYNVSFITVPNISGTANKSLCFNTDISSLDCFGISNPDPFIATRWSHFVFVFNNGDVTKNKIYINGQQKAVSKQGFNNPISRIVSNLFKIGVNYNNNSSLFRVKGDLGIVRVYDKEINSTEILNNYNEFKCLYQGLCS